MVWVVSPRPSVSWPLHFTRSRPRYESQLLGVLLTCSIFPRIPFASDAIFCCFLVTLPRFHLSSDICFSNFISYIWKIFWTFWSVEREQRANLSLYNFYCIRSSCNFTIVSSSIFIFRTVLQDKQSWTVFSLHSETYTFFFFVWHSPFCDAIFLSPLST